MKVGTRGRRYGYHATIEEGETVQPSPRGLRPAGRRHVTVHPSVCNLRCTDALRNTDGNKTVTPDGLGQ